MVECVASRWSNHTYDRKEDADRKMYSPPPTSVLRHRVTAYVNRAYEDNVSHESDRFSFIAITVANQNCYCVFSIGLQYIHWQKRSKTQCNYNSAFLHQNTNCPYR